MGRATEEAGSRCEKEVGGSSQSKGCCLANSGRLGKLTRRNKFLVPKVLPYLLPLVPLLTERNRKPASKGEVSFTVSAHRSDHRTELGRLIWSLEAICYAKNRQIYTCILPLAYVVSQLSAEVCRYSGASGHTGTKKKKERSIK